MQTLAQSVLLKALGWSLINSLWQMAVLWLVYFIITFNSKKFTASARHSLAAVLLCTGVAWFIFSFIYYCINIQSGINITSLFLISNANILLSAFSKTINAINQLLPYCACVYLLILTFHCVRYSRYFFQTNKLTNEGLHKMSHELRLFTEEIALRLGIQKKVQIFLSDIADSPMTIGFLKYIILIPLATINNLSTQQVEAILLHELAHIKRNDYLLNLMISVVEIIFFFNPFSRLFINVIKKERENSCDDLVMQFNYDPHIYVMALLSLEKSRHTYHPIVMAATGKNNKLLLQRVKRITGQKISQPRIKAKFIFFFLFSIIAGFIMQFQFKIIPAVFHTTVSATQNKKTNSEILQAVYLSSPTLEKNKVVKISHVKKEKIKPETDNAEVNNSDDENLVYINADQPDEQSANENVISAAQSEVINYSTPTPRATDLPKQNSAQSVYPYVPKSSFSFETVPDTASTQNLTAMVTDENAKEVLETTLKSLLEVDWKKLDNELSNNQKNIVVNIQKLKKGLHRALTAHDLKKISKSIQSTSTNDMDENRVKEDIQIQSDALEDLKSKNLLQAEKLQAEILQNQIKLQQTYLQKRQQVLRKINTVKRQLKIVEI
jgi:beta-lactamase regulating signal transducer with metallopeptidase domain